MSTHHQRTSHRRHPASQRSGLPPRSRFRLPPGILALAAVPALITASLGAAAAGGPAVTLDRQYYVMGTRLELHLRGDGADGSASADPAAAAATLEEAAAAAVDAVRELEATLSNWRHDSELAGLNRHAGDGPRAVSPALFDALATARELAVRTGGAFDPSIEPLTRAYDLRGSGRQPGPEALRVALAATGYSNLALDPDRRTATLLDPRAGIDLGGIGKGVALDRVRAVLEAHGVRRALINFGGQILALGEPQPGEPWRVEIADPLDRQRPAATLELRDASAATSSQNEHTLLTGGRAIGHVLDPRTGLPVPAWGSATAVAVSAAQADAYSTALLVMGPEAARRFADATPGLDAVLLEHDARQATPAGGAAPAPSNAELARRIDILAAELEAAQLGLVAGPPEPVAGFGPAASKVYQAPPGVSLGGYGETLYESFARRREDGAPSGRIDRLDLLRAVIYLGYKFNASILFNSEIEIEHASSEESGAVSAEFAYLDFRLARALGVRAGLLLVPVGFVNELHEPPVYLGARRPDVEQQIIPTTWRANGAGVFGETESGLSYRAYLIEGLDGAGYSAAGGIRGGRQAGSKSKVDDLAVVGRADYQSTRGLLFGGAVVSGGAAQGAVDGAGRTFAARTTLLEAHVQLRRQGFQARALVARVRVDDAERLNALAGLAGNASIGETMRGWYVEAGYDVLRRLAPGSPLQLIPYLRYESYDTQSTVPAGFAADPENDRTVVTAGAAFYPHPQVVVKGDLELRSNQADTGVDQLALALGFLF